MTETETSLPPMSHDDPALASFEGANVGATKATITSVSGLEVGDRVFHLDDSVKLIVEAKVAGIYHKYNEKTNQLERIHSLRAIDSVVVEWSMDMDALRDALSGD